MITFGNSLWWNTIQISYLVKRLSNVQPVSTKFKRRMLVHKGTFILYYNYLKISIIFLGNLLEKVTFYWWLRLQSELSIFFYDDEISFLEHLPRILFSCEQQTKGEKICWYGVVKVIVNKSWSELSLLPYALHYNPLLIWNRSRL